MWKKMCHNNLDYCIVFLFCFLEAIPYIQIKIIGWYSDLHLNPIKLQMEK